MFWTNALFVFSCDPALPRVRQQRLFQHHLSRVSCHTHRVQDHHHMWATPAASWITRITIGQGSIRNRRLMVFVFSPSLSAKISSTTLFSLTVNKSCSLPLDCSTPLNAETEWSVNRAFSRESHTQICCVGDNCNFQTLACKICSSLLPSQGDVSQSQTSQSGGQDTKMTSAS